MAIAEGCTSSGFMGKDVLWIFCVQKLILDVKTPASARAGNGMEQLDPCYLRKVHKALCEKRL